MLDGLPELGRYLTNLVLGAGRRDALAIVVFHHLGDVLDAVRFALGGSLTQRLDDPHLQNSSFGSPYRKWAEFTNDGFAKVDECVRRLLVASHTYYQRSFDPLTSRVRGNNKDAAHWFGTVARQFVSFRAELDQPRVTVGSVHLAGWVMSDEPTFLNVWNTDIARGGPAAPEIVSSRTLSIAERGALTALFPRARGNRDALAEALTAFATGLRADCSMEDVTARRGGNLSDFYTGVVTVAVRPPG